MSTDVLKQAEDFAKAFKTVSQYIYSTIFTLQCFAVTLNKPDVVMTLKHGMDI